MENEFEILLEYFRTNKEKFDLKDLEKKSVASGYNKKLIKKALARIELEEEAEVPELDEEDEEGELPVKTKEKKGFTFIRKLSKMKTQPKEMPILFLRNSGKVEIKKIVPKNGMFEVDGKFYHEKYGSDWEIIDGMNKKKIKIIPEWGLYPLGNENYLKELKSEQAEVQYDMIRAIQTAETVRYNEEKTKGKINPKLAILGIIVVIVIAYFIIG